MGPDDLYCSDGSESEGIRRKMMLRLSSTTEEQHPHPPPFIRQYGYGLTSRSRSSRFQGVIVTSVTGPAPPGHTTDGSASSAREPERPVTVPGVRPRRRRRAEELHVLSVSRLTELAQYFQSPAIH